MTSMPDNELVEWLETMGCGPMPTNSKNRALEKHYLSALQLLKEKFQESIGSDLPGKATKVNKKENVQPLKAEVNGKKKKILIPLNEPPNKDGVTKRPARGPKARTNTTAVERAAKPAKKETKEDSEDLTDALDNMKLQIDKGCSCKGDCKTKQCGCKKKDLSCSVGCKCSSQCVNKTALPEKVDMPAEDSYSEDSEDSEDSKDSKDSKDSEDKSAPGVHLSLDDTQELGKEEVDWERHLAKLMPCPKCCRKFFPKRLVKHVDVCKYS